MRSNTRRLWVARSFGCRRSPRKITFVGKNVQLGTSSIYAKNAARRRHTNLTADKMVRDDVKAVLDVIANNDMVLASEHLHVSETWLVFEEARRRGVRKITLTHPEDIVDASLNDVKGLATSGAFVEHSLCMLIEGSKFKTCELEDLKEISMLPASTRRCSAPTLDRPERSGRSKDFGKAVDFAWICYQDAEIRKMVSTNAARMLGIESDLPSA